MDFLHKWSYLCGLCLYFIETNILTDAGILPLVKQKAVQNKTVSAEHERLNEFVGYIEYQPNGTIVLRSDSLGNATTPESLALFQTLLRIIKVRAPPFDGTRTVPSAAKTKTKTKTTSATTAVPATKFKVKIYGEGVEHKFPPFLERIIQRIQTYFSVYRYTDTSRPLRPEEIAATATASSTYGQNGGGAPSNQNYLTTTIIEIGDPAGDAAVNAGLVSPVLNYAEHFEPTTPFVDADADAITYGHINGNEDYPEFIEIKSNKD